jgi:hypothetical protein
MRKFAEKISVPKLIVSLICCEFPESDGWYARFNDPAVIGGCNEVFIWRSSENFEPRAKLFYKGGLVETNNSHNPSIEIETKEDK